MPMCIVPGCTSGYSTNPEKVHFFTIPKDERSENLWKIAIKRTDSAVRSGRAVCEKHFRKEEIQWQRKLLDPSGQVLGVSQYKIPRLVKGSIPSIFPWTKVIEAIEPAPQLQFMGYDDGSHVMDETADVAKPPAKRQKLAEGNEEISVLIGKPAITEDHVKEVSLQDDERNPDNQSSLRFADLSAAKLCLPAGWNITHTSCEDRQLVVWFTLKSIKNQECIQTLVFKALTVKEDLSVEISVLDQQVNPQNIDVQARITSIDCLQRTIITIDRLNVCTGCTGSSVKQGMEHYNCSNLRKDLAGNWRHTKCIFMLPNSTICQFCRFAKKSLANKLRRWKQNQSKNKIIRRTVLKGTTTQLSKLQDKLRKSIRAKREAQEQMKALKTEIRTYRLQSQRFTIVDLEKQSAAGIITPNQLHVLKQILEATKHKNTKGRNFVRRNLLKIAGKLQK